MPRERRQFKGRHLYSSLHFRYSSLALLPPNSTSYPPTEPLYPLPRLILNSTVKPYLFPTSSTQLPFPTLPSMAHPQLYLCTTMSVLRTSTPVSQLYPPYPQLYPRIPTLSFLPPTLPSLPLTLLQPTPQHKSASELRISSLWPHSL